MKKFPDRPIEEKVKEYYPDKHYSFDDSKILLLDFVETEGRITFDEVKARAEKYDLPFVYAFNTYPTDKSGNNYTGFQLAFLNDAPVIDKKVKSIVRKALKIIFPGSINTQEKNYSLEPDYYLLKHFDKEIPEINVELLFRKMALYLKDTKGSTHYKSSLREFSNQTGLGLNEDGFPDVSIAETIDSNSIEDSSDNIKNIADQNNGKISPKSIISLSRNGENLPTLHYNINIVNQDQNTLNNTSSQDSAASATNEIKSKIHLPHRSSVLKDIKTQCRLFSEFKSNTRRLDEDELFGLATNINKIESGAKVFRNILESNSYFSDTPKKYEDWTFNLSYTKNYPSRSCNGFCPYKDECNHGIDLLTSKPKPKEIIRLANYTENFVSLEEAEADFEQRLLEAVDSHDQLWHILKAQTALGKTEAYLKLLKNTNLRILIAVPTIKLKKEILKRAKKMGIQYIIISPSLDDYVLTDDIKEEIEYLYRAGKPVTPFLREQIKKKHPCASVLKDYLNDLDAFREFDGHGITTHRRLMSMDDETLAKYDLVIVDEDIIFKSIVPNKGCVTIAKLNKLLKKLPVRSALAKKTRAILKKSKTAEFFTLPSIDYDKDDFEDISMAVDIPFLCEATHFCSQKVANKNDEYDTVLKQDSVSFYKPVEFKQHRYIMVSATANKKICKLYFGKENIRFHECEKARYTGTLLQYCDKTMSRAYIKKHLDVFTKIPASSGFQHLITFKKFNKGELYFGNLDGIDNLKGKNIDIIGTPHYPVECYKHFLFWLGLEEGLDDNLKNITVEHNGCRFTFSTFENTDLRTIQHYFIESDLEQAVGRARLLRCDCTVNLYSNFPLSQADLRESEYTKSEKD